MFTLRSKALDTLGKSYEWTLSSYFNVIILILKIEKFFFESGGIRTSYLKDK